MAPIDVEQIENMQQCQEGIRWPGGRTGRFCLKPHLCREEGACHFVVRAEHAIQRQYPIRRPIVWLPGFDEEEPSQGQLSLFEAA